MQVFALAMVLLKLRQVKNHIQKVTYSKNMYVYHFLPEGLHSCTVSLKALFKVLSVCDNKIYVKSKL